MLCQLCKQRNAVTFVQKRDGKHTEMIPICSGCASRLQYTDWSNLLEYFLSSAKEERSCPVCGATAAEISELGLVGCSRCYTVFADILRPSLERIHGKTVYRGKVPAVIVKNPAKIEDPVAVWKEKLKIAVQNEDYETAAVLRDRIRKYQRQERAEHE